MAADPPDDPFDDIADLIESSPPPERPEPAASRPRFGTGVIVIDASPVDRDRLLHELRRSLAATHPLEGEAIAARIETAILRTDPGAAQPVAAACPTCGCALRVLDRPREHSIDSAERAGLLASSLRSLSETRSDPRSLESLARELARRDVVVTREGGHCPLCNRFLVLPA